MITETNTMSQAKAAASVCLKTLDHYYHHLRRSFYYFRTHAGSEEDLNLPIASGLINAKHWSMLLPVLSPVEVRFSALMLAGVCPREMKCLGKTHLLFEPVQFAGHAPENLPVAIDCGSMNKGARRRMVHLTPTESVLLTLSMPTADKLFPGHLSEIMSGIRAKALALGIPVRQNLRWPTGEGAGIVEANRSTPSIEPGGTPRDFYCTLPLNTPDHLKKWVENWANSFSTTITLDIATATGWALLTRGQIHQTGTLVLATKEELAEQQKSGKNRTGDVRFAHLLAFLENQIKTGVERIVFEDVLFAKSPDQAQLWASLRAAIWAACRGTAVHVCCVSATTLKMFATANGAARKHQMAEALAKADPSYVVYDAESGSMLHDGKLIDDNQVDAIWLARYTVAVDAGEVRFQSVAESKAAAREAKRAERAALVAAAKATGRCCGLLRRPAPFGRAKCRKCGRVVTLGIHKPA